jgi:4-amino-4-deoxy-L-arabinose transferase-like glycosyltransferase
VSFHKPHGWRFCLFLLSLGLALLAAFPTVGLLPIRALVEQMTAPEVAPVVARRLFLAGAAIFAVVGWLWTFFSSATSALIARLAALQPTTFWLIVAFAAAVPRVLLGFTVGYEPVTDAAWYHKAALSLARGDGLTVDGQVSAYRGPGYAFLLALTYKAFGPTVGMAWVWGAVSTVVLLVSIFAIGRHSFNDAAARVATLMAAVYPALIFMTGQALSDLPFVAGLLALVAFMLKCTPYRVGNSILAGFAIGVLTLLRGVGIGLFIVVPVFWMLRHPDPRRFAVSACVIAAAFLISVAPWMIRNHAAFGHYTLGTNVGTNAYAGNHSGSSGGTDRYTIPPLAESQPDEWRRDRMLLDAAIEFVASQPAEAVTILPGKLLNLYLLETEAVSSLFQGSQPRHPAFKHVLYGVSQLSYLCVMLLLVARVASFRDPARRPKGIQWTGWILAAYFTGICLIFHSEDRYRLPILPWILLEGAVVLTRMRRLDGKSADAEGLPPSGVKPATAQLIR